MILMIKVSLIKMHPIGLSWATDTAGRLSPRTPTIWLFHLDTLLRPYQGLERL